MRGISKERMIVLLQDVPSGTFITTNAQGNIKLTNKDGYYGYIDVDEKKLVLAEKHNG